MLYDPGHVGDGSGSRVCLRGHWECRCRAGLEIKLFFYPPERTALRPMAGFRRPGNPSRQPGGNNSVSLVLSLVNPVNATVMACVKRTGAATMLPRQIPAIVGELLAAWTNRLVTANTPVETSEPSANQADNVNTGLRPVYRGLVAARAQVRREPVSTSGASRISALCHARDAVGYE